MADGTIWRTAVARETLQELADRQVILALLRRNGDGLTTRQIADGLRMDGRIASATLRYMREDGLVESRNVSAGRNGGTVLCWTAAPVVPGGAPQPKRKLEPRMLPVFQELHVDAILRRDCRHETECVSELDDAYPDARHAVCREDCVYFEVIAPVPAPSAPSMLARAAGMMPDLPEFSREELDRLVSRGAGAKARKGGDR